MFYGDKLCVDPVRGRWSTPQYYGNEVAIYALSPVELIAGLLPRRQQRLVEAWAELHEAELLLADRQLLQSGQVPLPIAPL